LSNVHTLAASYVSQSAIQAGSAATAASERKTAKYSNLSSSHVFCPVAVETFGALADDALVFLTDIRRRAMLCTADSRQTTLYQRCIFRDSAYFYLEDHKCTVYQSIVRHVECPLHSHAVLLVCHRRMYVNNLLESLRGVKQPGVEPATSQ